MNTRLNLLSGPAASEAATPAAPSATSTAARAPETIDPAVRLAQLYARPGFLLRRAHQISVAIFECACADIELTPAQFGVLCVLSARPGIDQASLARAVGLDKVTTLHLVRGLTTRGLVSRSPASEGRRSIALSLTPRADALLELADPCVEQAYERLMASLTLAQQEQLLSLLNELNTRLESAARTAFQPIVL
ncbi:MAG: MarR family winged helix-turn-helix transcriptional regulator [Janthinobacterium lividum]